MKSIVENTDMNKPVQASAFHRMQQLMTPSPVPSISTELLTTADGELNRELNAFLFDPPSNPNLLKSWVPCTG
jgi:protease I